MTPSINIIARNLRVLRQARGLKQIELSVIAGVDRSYITRLESGKANVSIKKLDRLADTLGVASWEMLHPETKAKPARSD